MRIGNEDYPSDAAYVIARRVKAILHIAEGCHGVGGIEGGIFQVARVRARQEQSN